MRKIAFIGGGSSKFVAGFLVDILCHEELEGSQVTLMDVDEKRVRRTERLVKKMIADKKAPLTVDVTLDQRRALAGADYVIVTVMVGGMKHYESDTFIPAKHGVSVAVGDTVGPGAVFRAIRTFPVLRQMADNLKAVAPNALVLNYSNPMALLTNGLLAYGHPQAAGLCHSVQSAPGTMHKWLGIPAAEVDYLCAGCNHISFYLKLEHKGRDLYPGILANAERIIKMSQQFDPVTLKWRPDKKIERVRMEIVKYLGYLPAEGPHHQSEYYPWFRKTLQLAGYYGSKTGWGCEFDRYLNPELDNTVNKKIRGEVPIEYKPTREYGINIISSIETGTVRTCNVNVLNNGSITNLPADAVVEVPCLVDKFGIHPCQVGPLPMQLVGVIHPHIVLHQLALAGILTKSKTKIRQAIQADPLTAACLTLPETEAMTDELFAANKKYMQDWK